jgi:L-ascorbate metabolism protein UlaG (beta-lactamase superfamily)
VADFGSARAVFDPLLPWRARRAGPVDAVLITHSHVDHLNRWSLKAIDRAAHLVVPKGAKEIVNDLGFSRVTELNLDEEVEIHGMEITAVATRHDHGRWSKGDSPIAVGYVVSANGHTIHHAGDVDFSDHSVFDDIGKRHAIDAALLPIGGMMPVWYYRRRRHLHDRGIHIDPDSAVDIYERLGAKAMIPIHWGTLHFRMGFAGMPKRRLAQLVTERSVAGVQILAHGERLPLTR